jgi:hypothetical protein
MHGQPARFSQGERTAAMMFAALALGSLATDTRAAPTDATVSGVAIPQTPLALKAAQFARLHSPEFLFNHSMRTYIYGALGMKAHNVRFDPETAFVAAALHDLGLMPGSASAQGSFEVDGANLAEKFVKDNGGSEQQARTVWNAIAMHDVGRAFQSHQSGNALLVGYGAGTDVDGPDPKVVTPEIVAQTLRAFPRAGFKTGFTALAVDHCKRKPTSQFGWLDGLCREVAPNVDRGSVRDEIQSAPYAD